MRKIHITGGLYLSDIALGHSGRGTADKREEAFRIMDRYLALGGDTFDSARVYSDGEADRAFGQWLRSRGVARESVRYVTKGSFPPPDRMEVSRLSSAEIARDLDESLALSGLNFSDLHLLHRDDVRIPVEALVPRLDALVRTGKTRAVGVSNWTAPRIAEANAFAHANGLTSIVCSQLLFGLAQTTPAATGDLTHVVMDDAERTWYLDSALPVMCFGTQARGWFAACAAGKAPKESPKQYYDRLPENRRRLARLTVLAQALGQPMPAVLLAYVRDCGLRSSALISFSGVAQLEEALRTDAFRLAPAQIAYLERGGTAAERFDPLSATEEVNP
ncbi:MAG: aldo/keto reductase [Oscillospiraceae bacterium]|jgi:aryl-alcohol dehydrogenase-like predicted oxidoreductase|nr:aldo/keto reductase [Oscillospiraceae bacterium]